MMFIQLLFYFNMGIRISKNIPMNTLRLDDYDQVHMKHKPGEFTDYRIMKNRLTGNQMEEYSLLFGNSTEYQDYYDAYYWRLSQDHVVRTLHFIDSTKNQFCSTVYAAKLYIERIPIKLSDFKDIPYPDNLYVLLASLDGFDRIVQKAGYFQIQQYMIGINRQGEVKVWINDNLSKNYPDSMRSRVDGSQQAMVKRLIAIIQKNTDQTSQPSSVSQYIYSQVSNPSFGDAMLLVRQFARQNRTEIPNNFQCILEVLNDSKYPSDASHTQQSVSRFSKSHIKSSVPVQYGVNLRTNTIPGFQTQIMTSQTNNRIPQYSRISNQISSNSRLNTFQRSVIKKRNQVIQHDQLHQIPRHRTPIAAAPHIPVRQVTISPERRALHLNQSTANISPQKIFSHHQFQNHPHPLSINKTVSYANNHFVPFWRNNLREVRLPTPSDARHLVQIEHHKENRTQHESQREGRLIIQEYHQPKSRSNQLQSQYNNILIQNKQEEVRNIPPERKNSGGYQQALSRQASPQKDLVSEFINPFFQQQEEPSPGFVTPNSSTHLILNTREKDRILIQTPDDLRNQQQVEQIKRKKTILLKQAKQVVNRMMRESHQMQMQYHQNNYKYQNYGQQPNVGNSVKCYNQQGLSIHSNINGKGSHRLKMSFDKTNLGANSGIMQRVERVQRNQVLVYHSPGDCHHIDPQIARDLLAMVD